MNKISNNPNFWVVTWITLNIAITILNKSVFQFANFRYPLILSASHMICIYLFCFIIFDVMRWVPVDPNIMPSTIRKIQVLSLLFTLNICAGNVGLLYASVSLREVVRSLTPGITLAFSVWLLNKSYRMDAVWSLIAIAVGVIITTATELDLNMWWYFGCIERRNNKHGSCGSRVGSPSLCPLRDVTLGPCPDDSYGFCLW